MFNVLSARRAVALCKCIHFQCNLISAIKLRRENRYNLFVRSFVHPIVKYTMGAKCFAMAMAPSMVWGGTKGWQRAIIFNIPRVQFAKACNNADGVAPWNQNNNTEKKVCMKR